MGLTTEQYSLAQTLYRLSTTSSDNEIVGSDKNLKESIEEIRSRLSIDFKGTKLIDFIIFNYTNRFNDVSPYDFEDFIAFILSASGFEEVEVTKSSSDYGVDVLAKTEHQETIAIQVKRYAENNKVGVQELNQLIGGTNFYKCERGLLITTSDLTKNAWILAKETNVEVWVWEDIFNRIVKNIFYNHSLQDFKINNFSRDDELATHLHNIIPNVKLTDGSICVKIELKIINKSSDLIQINGVSKNSCLMRENGYQINNFSRDSDDFLEGIIYPKGFAIMGFFFPKDKIENIKFGDKLLVDFICELKDYFFEVELSEFTIPNNNENIENVHPNVPLKINFNIQAFWIALAILTIVAFIKARIDL